MKPKNVYLGLCFVGFVLPYWQFVPWVSAHGLSLALFARELFANRISAFFGMDVLVSAVVLIAFMRIESRRRNIPRAGCRLLGCCWWECRWRCRCFFICGRWDKSPRRGRNCVILSTGAGLFRAGVEGPLYQHVLLSSLRDSEPLPRGVPSAEALG